MTQVGECFPYLWWTNIISKNITCSREFKHKWWAKGIDNLVREFFQSPAVFCAPQERGTRKRPYRPRARENQGRMSETEWDALRCAGLIARGQKHGLRLTFFHKKSCFVGKSNFSAFIIIKNLWKLLIIRDFRWNLRKFVNFVCADAYITLICTCMSHACTDKCYIRVSAYKIHKFS